MAITVSTIQAPIDNTAAWAMTTIDANAVTSGHTVRMRKDGKMVLVITNTATATRAVTIKAGEGLHKSLGDKTVILAANTGAVVFGPLSSSRFRKGTGFIDIEYGSGMTGQIAAVAI